MSNPARATPTGPRPDLRTRLRRSSFVHALPFLLPVVLIYGSFVLYPLASSTVLSFFEWDGLTPERTFVGLENFEYIFTKDPVFWTAFRNSVLWVALSLIIPVGMGLGMALVLNQALRGRTVFRAAFYLPAALAAIAAATMFRWIYNPVFGLLNGLLDTLGLEHLSSNWLGEPATALYSIFIASVWQSAGVNMVLFLAGLQLVRRDLIESALIDGANAWQLFRNVTVPALRGTFIVVIVLTVIGSLKAYDLIVGMTGGGPAQSTQMLALWSVDQSFGQASFGRGSAVAMVLLALTLVIVVPYLLFTQRTNDDE